MFPKQEIFKHGPLYHVLGTLDSQASVQNREQ